MAWRAFAAHIRSMGSAPGVSLRIFTSGRAAASATPAAPPIEPSAWIASRRSSKWSDSAALTSWAGVEGDSTAAISPKAPSALVDAFATSGSSSPTAWASASAASEAAPGPKASRAFAASKRRSGEDVSLSRRISASGLDASSAHSGPPQRSARMASKRVSASGMWRRWTRASVAKSAAWWPMIAMARAPPTQSDFAALGLSISFARTSAGCDGHSLSSQTKRCSPTYAASASAALTRLSALSLSSFSVSISTWSLSSTSVMLLM
mmetsp:Transcript_65349/g.191721  ORF Transcript_65349/g.191721 Transcript_65349/m.191721 type:complete len:265 (+) Transcript_65349:281-1075(+)